MDRQQAKRFALRQEAEKAIQALGNMGVYSQDPTLTEAYKLAAMIHELNLIIAANQDEVMPTDHNPKQVMPSASCPRCGRLIDSVHVKASALYGVCLDCYKERRV